MRRDRLEVLAVQQPDLAVPGELRQGHLVRPAQQGPTGATTTQVTEGAAPGWYPSAARDHQRQELMVTKEDGRRPVKGGEQRQTTTSTPDSYGPLSEKPEVRSEATQVAVDRYLGGQSGGGRS